jgi:hypothetical protein
MRQAILRTIHSSHYVQGAISHYVQGAMMNFRR